MSYKKNDEVELEILDMTKLGLGISKIGGQVFFVKNAIVGDVVKAVITKVNADLIYAKAIDIIKKSSLRVDSECDVSDSCGGCQLLNLDYNEQLKLKKKNVFNCIRKIGKFSKDITYDGIMSSHTPYNFRNKMQIPYVMRDGEILYGFYAGRTHHIIQFDKCIVGFKNAEVILSAIKEALLKHSISIYDETSKTGIFREVLFRCGNVSKEISITYILNDKNYNKNIELYKSFDKTVRKLIDEKLCATELSGSSETKDNYRVVTSTININTSNTNVIFGNINVVLSGNGYIEDKIGDIRYHVSPESFYQVNMEMTKKLYDKALEYADFNGDEKVLDLYCGIGTISLYISKYVKKVLGVEIVDKAIENAISNARLNDISNVDFVCKDVNDLIVSENDFDVVVVDPPRRGLDEKVINYIKYINPKKIIYVSCDPATLARDLDIFCHSGDHNYILKKFVNADMFPHTMHVETIALLMKD